MGARARHEPPRVAVDALKFGPRRDEMLVMTVSNGRVCAPRGVRGGQDAQVGGNFRRNVDGTTEELPGYVVCKLQHGESIIGLDNGGGGYGDPTTRDPHRVLMV